jgi:hypothetical protein
METIMSNPLGTTPKLSPRIMLPEAPFVSRDLVEWLQECFPDKLPGVMPQAEQLAFMMGQQDIIRRLNGLLLEQEDERQQD